MSVTQREKDLAQAVVNSNPQAYILAQDHRSNSMEQATLPPLDGYSIRAEPWRGDDIPGLARRILTLNDQGHDLGTDWYVHITERDLSDVIKITVGAERGSNGVESRYRGTFGCGDAMPILDIVKGLDRYGSEAISKTRAPLHPTQLEDLLQTAIRERLEFFIEPLPRKTPVATARNIDPAAKGVLAWADLPRGTSQAPPKPESTSFVNGYVIKAWPQQTQGLVSVLLFTQAAEGTLRVECREVQETPNKLHIVVQAPGMTLFQGKMTKGGTFPAADIMKCLQMPGSAVVHKQLQEALQEAYTKKITLELYTPISGDKTVAKDLEISNRILELREPLDTSVGKYEVVWYDKTPAIHGRGVGHIHICYGPDNRVSAKREHGTNNWNIISSTVPAPGRIATASSDALADTLWAYSMRPPLHKEWIRRCVERAFAEGRDFEIIPTNTLAKDLVLFNLPRPIRTHPISDPSESIKDRLEIAIAKDKAEPELLQPGMRPITGGTVSLMAAQRADKFGDPSQAKIDATAPAIAATDVASTSTKPSLSSKGVFSMFSKLRYLALIVGVLVGGNVAGRYDVDVAAPFMKIVSGALGGLGNVTTPEVIYEGVLVSYENGLYTFEDKTVLSEIVIEGPVYFGQKVKVYSGNRSYYMKRVVD